MISNDERGSVSAAQGEAFELGTSSWLWLSLVRFAYRTVLSKER
jgi:hypothetical protein